MPQTRQTSDLPSWIAEVSDRALAGLAAFTKGLRAGLNVVPAGFASNWASGIVSAPRLGRTD
ncbi:hypothetical protein AB0E08_49665 [Streptomyces sp. NPDC048281]|uniref:hypothetical protein n=1 Tax=Streptomyces sp. NPDC048281 TaxID=3154715 RepID=UPI003449FA75